MPWMTMPSKNTEPKQTLARGSANTLRKPGATALKLKGFDCAGLQAAKGEESNHRDDRGRKPPMRQEHAAPAEQIADDAGDHGADQISSQSDRQQPADRDLARMHRHEIADDRDADRKNAAGQMPAMTRMVTSSVKLLAKAQISVVVTTTARLDIHQPGLAEEIADGAERRLHDGVGKRERGRQ